MPPKNQEKFVSNKKKVRKPASKKLFQYDVCNMEEAVKAVREGRLGKREAAKLFNVPKTSLLRKIKGDVPIHTKMGPSTILTTAEETLLEEYILSMYKKGFPVHKENICNSVGKIMKKANRNNVFPSGRPGKTWFKAFLKRHPKLSERNAEALTKSRAEVSVEGIKAWFSEVESYFKEEGLEDVLEDPSRIFNADETGFKLCPKTGKVLCQRGDKACYIQVQNNEKEQISVLGCFSANGDIVPPMLIYPYKRLPRAVAQSVPDGWGIGLSSSGWMNSEVFYEYLSNFFIPHLKAKKVTLPVVLFVDGYSSHITMEVSELCSENNVILIAFHPNTTHFLQPADVSVFGPLKKEWITTVRKWRFENYPKEVTRETFAKLLEICFSNLSAECVKSGFRTCGIYPFSVDSVNYNKVIKARITVNPMENKVTYKTMENFNNPIEEDKYKTRMDYLKYMETFIDEERLVQFARVFESRNEWWEEYPNDTTAKELYEVWRGLKQQAVIDETQNYNPIVITVPHNVGDIGFNDSNDQILFQLDQEDMEIELSEGDQVKDINVNYYHQIESLKREDENSQEIDDPVILTPVYYDKDQLSPPLSLVNSAEENSSPGIIPGSSNDNKDLLPVSTVVKDAVNDPLPSSNSKTHRRDQSSILSPFKQCLMWPKTPPRNMNNVNVTRRKKFPSVVSSDKWKIYFKKKEQEKEEKNNKKRSRTKKNDDDWICKNCKSSWNDENKQKLGLKWVNCDKCGSAYHFKCIPKYHKDSFGLESDSDDEELNFTCHLCSTDDEDTFD